MSKILVTGATGFVGSALCKRLAQSYDIVPTAHNSNFMHIPTLTNRVVRCDLTPDFDWSSALIGVQTVIHCAARVHITHDNDRDPLRIFRLVNVDGTMRLARQAAEAGVRQFIFMSSIKVNGEKTLPNHPFTADQIPAPLDPYGISKYEAEIKLQELAISTGMEIVIIRPPLIYGPGVKANFLSMMKWVNLGFPLPFGGAIHNQRSFLYLENLIDLIITCIDNPAAKNQIFLAADGEDLSTAALLYRMSKALGCSIRLLPIPDWLIVLAAKLIRKPGITERLYGSLQVDIRNTKELLNWNPPVLMDVGLRKTAEDFLKIK